MVGDRELYNTATELTRIMGHIIPYNFPGFTPSHEFREGWKRNGRSNARGRLRMRKRSRVTVNLSAWLGPFFLIICSALVCPTEMSAAEMTVRDILYLNQYEEGVRGISWCDDDNFILMRPAAPYPTLNAPNYHDFVEMYVKTFSMETKTARPLLQYHNSNIAVMSVTCLRNGEYAYVGGRTGVAGTTDPAGWVQLPLSHLIDLTKGGRAPRYFHFESGGPEQLSTASDGSVYGGTQGPDGIDLSFITNPKSRSSVKDRMTYHQTNEVVTLISYATVPRTPFPVYGLSSKDFHTQGSYRCPAPRPGCSVGGKGRNVVYYVFSQYSDAQYVDDAEPGRASTLFTITPDKTPLMQRWPVVPRPGVDMNALDILDVVVDERRCLVLLEPKSWLKSNRVNGRLRLDVYVANCGFRGSTLEFDEPRIVGRRRASFMVPHVSLHGEHIAIVEKMNMNEQPEDQAEFEKDWHLRLGPCAYIYRSEAMSMRAINTICVSKQDSDVRRFKISPNAKYVGMEGNKDSVIVGREYRNDGTGPKGISNGDRP